MTVPCDRHYTVRGNGTMALFGEYESIPKTFVLNLIAWPLLLLLFSILRKLAWDYGRIALVSRDEEKWMSLFFGERPTIIRRPHSSGSVESLDRTMKRQDKGFCSWLPAFFQLKDEHIRRKCGNDAVQYLQFQRYLISYAVVICLISLGVILPINFMGTTYEAGHFARTTISNLRAGDPQLWIHFLLSIVYLVIGIVFMRHFSKNLQFYRDEQASRTLMVTGVPTRPSVCELTSLIQKHFRRAYGRVGTADGERVRLVDVHFAFDIRRLLRLDQLRVRAKLALLNMDLLSSQHADADTDADSPVASQYRLAFVDAGSSVPAQMCAGQPHRRSESEGQELHVHARCDSRVCSDSNGSECPQLSAANGSARPHASCTPRPTLHPYVCGQLLCCNALSSLPCCDCCAEVDAEAFYRNEVQHYTRKCAAEQRRALMRPCGIMFLTFESAQQARAVLIDFKRTNLLAAATPRVSTCSTELGVSRWSVKYSPEANNIFWENLAVSSIVWWLKAVLINLTVFVVAFLFTTPSFIMNELRRVDLEARLTLAFERDVPFFVEFVHLLIIVLFSSLLPYLVSYTNQFVGNWTRSTAHLVVMYKSYIFLVLMILVLPSIGFTSALLFVLSFFRAVFIERVPFDQNWRCIFEPSNGAFFVRYVMTAGFIGTSLELLRFADLFLFTLRMFSARSVAERATIRKGIIDEFEFGRNYAHQLCVFAVIVAYSIPVPLVTPFGVIYIALRYAVDRHNLYFAFKPSRIDKHIHTSAINFFMSSLILLQVNVVFYLTNKTESRSQTDSNSVAPSTAPADAVPPGASTVASRITSAVSADSSNLAWQVLQVSAIGTFLVTLIVVCGCSMFDWFKNVSPIVYTSRQTSRQPPAGESDAANTAPARCALHDGLQNGNSSAYECNVRERQVNTAAWSSFHGQPDANGLQQTHCAADGQFERPRSASHPTSTDQLVETQETTRCPSPIEPNAERERQTVNNNAPPRRPIMRRRLTAFVPSILLECYDELPLAHGETCDCNCRSSSKHSTSATHHCVRGRDAVPAGCARAVHAADAPKDPNAIICVYLDDANADQIDGEKANNGNGNGTGKRDKMRRSISLSPQSRAGYETIEMRDYDDEDDDEELQDAGESEPLSPKHRASQKRCSFDLSTATLRNSSKIDSAVSSEAINSDRANAPHVRTKTHPPGEQHSSASARNAVDKCARAYTVTRSPTTVINALCPCPQITVTAPTPIRERSVELLPRPLDQLEHDEHEQHDAVAMKESNSSCTPSENTDTVANRMLLNEEAESNSASGNGNGNDTDESNVDEIEVTCSPSDSAVPHSNAQRNFAFS